MHDIPTNYLYTDVEVRGNSFKETVTEGNEQKKIVLEKTCSARPRWRLATPGEKAEYV